MCQHMAFSSAGSRALLAYQCCLNSSNAKNIMDMLKHVAPMVLQDLPCPPLAPEQLKKEAAHACELLQAHYSAGKPFFSKAQLRDLAEQLARCKRNPGSPIQTIAVRGLDGRAVSFPVEIGKDHGCHPRGPEFRIIATTPALRYCPPAAAPAFFHPSLALLPVEIAFATKISSSFAAESVQTCSSVSAATVGARLALARQHQRDSSVPRLCALLKPVLPEETVKVVAFACGTMGSVGDGDGVREGGEEGKGVQEMVGRSTAQHALTLGVRDLLQGRAGRDQKDVRCYAQDPGYTAVDEQVLGEEGVEVAEDPRGFLEVDETSVVISVCPNVPVRQIMADIARPAVLIWDRVKGDEGDGMGCQVTDPVSTRVIEMLEEYHELPWSSEEDAFKSLAVYVRRSA